MGLHRIAFIFPGQESLAPGAALDLVERSSRIRGLLRFASRSIGHDLERLVMRGGPRLTKSEVIQPALTAISLGVVGELRAAGISPDSVAGLSLGEIAAWSAAGCIEEQEAIRIAAIRGRVMGEIATRHSGGLLALRVEDEATVARALAVGREHGFVDVAARNAPDETVITGQEAALRAIAARFSSRRLSVAGPWHCELMVEGMAEIRPAFDGVPRTPATARFVTNRTCEFVEPDESIPDLLVEQLVHPIEWSRALHTLADAGASTFVTIGPGKVLRSLIRRNVGEAVRVLQTDDIRDLSGTIETLTGPRR